MRLTPFMSLEVRNDFADHCLELEEVFGEVEVPDGWHRSNSRVVSFHELSGTS